MKAKDLAALVEEGIRSGKYLPGNPIPSEHAMADEHGVSRTLVREAYAMLMGKNLIVKRQGYGTFVRQ